MSEAIHEDDAQYAWDIVNLICTKAGPGVPGSPQERERAGLIQQELEAHLDAQQVALEEFSFAPGALLGSQRISAMLMLIAALLNSAIHRFAGIPSWLISGFASGLALFSILIYFLEFIFSYEFVDLLFKPKRSVNVVGTLRKPGTGTVKRLLILSGHHDSAWENNWLRHTGYGMFILSGVFWIALFSALLMNLIQLAGVISGNSTLVRIGTIGWPGLVFLFGPAAIYALFFHKSGKDGGTVPGAVDNLAASAITVALCRYLVRNPSCIPDETEIRFVSFGSEEAGLRGSRRYLSQHLAELQKLNARLLNIEMVAHPEITILSSDINGTVKNDSEMVKSLVTAAERARVPYQVRPAHLGIGTDAGPFSRAGLKAAALLPFKEPQQLVEFYHQEKDGPEVLTIEPLLNVLKLALEWVTAAGQ